MNPVDIEIIVGLHVFFQDYKKISVWLKTENTSLGGITPLHMMANGRSKKLLKFINTALDNNLESLK